jgi:hypothetical protein
MCLCLYAVVLVCCYDMQLALEQQRIPGLMCHGADPARKLMQACVNLYKVLYKLITLTSM